MMLSGQEMSASDPRNSQSWQPEAVGDDEFTGTAPLLQERQIFLSGPVVVFKWRNAPGWPVEYVSPNAASVFGYSPREFLEGSVVYAELIEPPDLDRVVAEVQAATDGGAERFAHLPYRVRHRDGSTVWLDDFTTILRDSSGAATHYLGYVIDVSARRRAELESERLEAQVLHTQKLESLGVMAGGIAHDFNNYLTTILGNAELLRAEVTDAAQGQSLDDVISAAKHAAALCTQMLAYAGKGRFTVEVVSVNRLIGGLASLLEASVGRSARLELDLGEDAPAVEADASQLSQVVMNLVTNAGEALADAPGVVRLSTRRRSVDGHRLIAAGASDELPTGQYLSIVVEDDGCGMDVETEQHLFDPFFSTKLDGRGLGLAAVLGIVRGHGGGIDVQTREGEGSRFEVLLPATTVAAAPQAGSAARRPSLVEGADVLVVDDEGSVRRLTERVLRGAGFGAVVVRDGEQALSLLRERPARFSAALVDLTMPGLNGADTCRALRRIRSDLPVVLMSGYGAEDVLGQLADLDVDGFVHKPFSPEHLAEVLRMAIGSTAG